MCVCVRLIGKDPDTGKEGFPGDSDGKESAYSTGDPRLTPESGRCPGEGNGSPLQYSCLEISMERRSGGPQCIGSQRLNHDWVKWLRQERSHLKCGRPEFDPWVEKIPRRRAWQPTPGFLPGESPRTEEPGGLPSVGLQIDGHDWATKHSTAHSQFVPASSAFFCLLLGKIEGKGRNGWQRIRWLDSVTDSMDVNWANF